MLRLLIGTGLLLMALGFGAAGWQYWKTLPQAEAATAPDDTSDKPTEARPEALPVRQSWLIAPTGGLVAQSDVRAYLAQDRFVPERTVEITLQAPLVALISEGEKLPEPTFLQVLADIRAPKIAEGLCNRLRQTIAADCAVNAARALEDSVNAAAGTARFRVELVYRMKEDGADLPDLAAHVFRMDRVRADLPAVPSAEAALDAAIATTASACAADGAGQICRPLRIALDWMPGQPVTGVAVIGWLEPLPKGMFAAPPLDEAPKD
jgi:hypothetical protein